MAYRLDKDAPIKHTLAELRKLPVGTVVGGESGWFARKEDDRYWTIAFPDNAYANEGGYRIERHRWDLPPSNLFIAREA